MWVGWGGRQRACQLCSTQLQHPPAAPQAQHPLGDGEAVDGPGDWVDVVEPHPPPRDLRLGDEEAREQVPARRQRGQEGWRGVAVSAEEGLRCRSPSPKAKEERAEDVGQRDRGGEADAHDAKPPARQEGAAPRGAHANTGQPRARGDAGAPTRPTKHSREVDECQQEQQHKPEELACVHRKPHHPAEAEGGGGGARGACAACVSSGARQLPAHNTTRTNRRWRSRRSPEPAGRAAPRSAAPARRQRPSTCQQRAPWAGGRVAQGAQVGWVPSHGWWLTGRAHL